MNVVSVCSGVGGIDLGLERAGMTITHQCEIDPHCRDVLARHWPDTPIHHDLTTLDGSTLGHVDLVAGGTPCTDLSVAGRRAGLAGEQSRIFWDFCRVAAATAARWVLWENVAGALSSNGGEDFAAVLWGLTGFHPAVPPDGWRTIGVCVGPDRAAVWRVLDAQWYGVAQRRRRVFVVAGPREQCSLEVLVEPESVPRGARPGGASGESAAGSAPDRVGEGEYVGSLMGGGWRIGADEAAAGHIIPLAVVAALTANGVGAGGGVDDNAAQAGHLVVDLAQITSPDNRSNPQPGDPAPNGGSSRQNGVLTPNLAVRRLTPREAERLMGWPDDWTRWRPDGTEIADSHRYRMCGNGVVTPVAEWIGRRIIRAEETT